MLPIRRASVREWERTLFGALVLGGFILSLGTLAWFPVPEPNRELISQAMGALGMAVGAIVNSIWRPSSGPADPKSNADGKVP